MLVLFVACALHSTPVNRKNSLELYEYATVRERQKADQKVKEYYLGRGMKREAEGSLGINRFSLYGYQDFEAPRREEFLDVFRSVFWNPRVISD